MTTTEGRSLAHLLDVDSTVVIVKTCRWLGFRLGVPAHVMRQAVRVVLSTEVPITPLLDEVTGERVGTLVEADQPALMALAHEALVDYLTSAGWPVDPAQWA